MITSKEEYDNCKAQVVRQRVEITNTRKAMDNLEISVAVLEAEVDALKDTYEPVEEIVEEEV